MGKYESERLNVRNGIALSRLHDAAFDVGLITFDSELRLKLSKQLKSYLPDGTIEQNFVAFEGKPLQLSKEAALPDENFLAVHRAKALQRWS